MLPNWIPSLQVFIILGLIGILFNYRYQKLVAGRDVYGTSIIVGLYLTTTGMAHYLVTRQFGLSNRCELIVPYATMALTLAIVAVSLCMPPIISDLDSIERKPVLGEEGKQRKEEVLRSKARAYDLLKTGITIAIFLTVCSLVYLRGFVKTDPTESCFSQMCDQSQVLAIAFLGFSYLFPKMRNQLIQALTRGKSVFASIAIANLLAVLFLRTLHP